MVLGGRSKNGMGQRKETGVEKRMSGGEGKQFVLGVISKKGRLGREERRVLRPQGGGVSREGHDTPQNLFQAWGKDHGGGITVRKRQTEELCRGMGNFARGENESGLKKDSGLRNQTRCESVRLPELELSEMEPWQERSWGSEKKRKT